MSLRDGLLVGGVGTLALLGAAKTMREFKAREAGHDASSDGSSASLRLQLESREAAPFVPAGEPEPPAPVTPQLALPPAVDAWTPSETRSAIVRIPSRVYEVDGTPNSIVEFVRRKPDGVDNRIMQAITLYTNGNVESVVDPTRYDEDRADQLIQGVPMEVATAYLADPAIEEWIFHHARPSWLYPADHGIQREAMEYLADPTREAYEDAAKLIRLLANARLPSRATPTVYRGIQVTAQFFAARFRAGALFDMRGISSWSEDAEVAHDMARTPGDAPTVGVVFVTNQIKTGAPIYDVSIYREEFEWLSGGTWRIVDVLPPRTEPPINSPVWNATQLLDVWRSGRKRRVRAGIHIVEVEQLAEGDPMPPGQTQAPISIPSRWNQT